MSVGGADLGSGGHGILGRADDDVIFQGPLFFPSALLMSVREKMVEQRRDGRYINVISRKDSRQPRNPLLSFAYPRILQWMLMIRPVSWEFGPFGLAHEENTKLDVRRASTRVLVPVSLVVHRVAF